MDNIDFDSIVENAQNDTEGDGNFKYTQTMICRMPKPEEQIPINVSAIEKLQKECEKLEKKRFPLSEIILSIAMLFGGGFFSALISGVTYELSFVSVFSYTVCPTLCVVGIILYFVFRNKSYTSAMNLVWLIGNVLPPLNDDDHKKSNR